MAAKAPRPAQLVQPRKHAVVVEETPLAPKATRRSWKQVLGIAAKAPEPSMPIEQKPPVHEPALGSPVVPNVEQPSQKPAAPIAARIQEPAKPLEQPQRELAIRSQAGPNVAQPSQKPAPRIAAKAQKRVKPPKPAQPKASEPKAGVNEAERDPLDYLKDAVVEWGVKREGDKESESSGT